MSSCWECHACSYDNDDTNRTCKICRTPQRPSAYIKSRSIEIEYCLDSILEEKENYDKGECIDLPEFKLNDLWVWFSFYPRGDMKSSHGYCSGYIFLEHEDNHKMTFDKREVTGNVSCGITTKSINDMAREFEEGLGRTNLFLFETIAENRILSIKISVGEDQHRVCYEKETNIYKRNMELLYERSKLEGDITIIARGTNHDHLQLQGHKDLNLNSYNELLNMNMMNGAPPQPEMNDRCDKNQNQNQNPTETDPQSKPPVKKTLMREELKHDDELMNELFNSNANANANTNNLNLELELGLAINKENKPNNNGRIITESSKHTLTHHKNLNSASKLVMSLSQDTMALDSNSPLSVVSPPNLISPSLINSNLTTGVSSVNSNSNVNLKLKMQTQKNQTQMYEFSEKSQSQSQSQSQSHVAEASIIIHKNHNNGPGPITAATNNKFSNNDIEKLFARSDSFEEIKGIDEDDDDDDSQYDQNAKQFYPNMSIASFSNTNSRVHNNCHTNSRPYNSLNNSHINNNNSNSNSNSNSRLFSTHNKRRKKKNELRVSSLILRSASKVFNNILSQNMREKNSKVIEIECKSIKDIDDMIYFMVVNKLRDDSNALNIIRLAHYFQLEHLFNECLNRIMNDITVETFVETVLIFERYNVVHGYMTLVEYGKQNLHLIKQERNFSQLSFAFRYGILGAFGCVAQPQIQHHNNSV